jgi:hypothetical protein
MNRDPVAAPRALTPLWMLAIRDYDALEVHPCCAISDANAVEICQPDDAAFWSVYGHCRTGGIEFLEDFATEAEARAFMHRIKKVYPHLAARLR